MGLISSNKVDTNKAELLIEVKGEAFKSAVDAAFKKNAARISLPGFRKGKAPRALIEKTYGMGMFYEDAMNALYPDAYTKAMAETDFEPVAPADIEIQELGPDGFSFKATVVTRPEVELGTYKGIELSKDVKAVTDEELEAELSRVREQYARVLTVEDRAAKNGDTAVIDFEGFQDGVAFEGGKGEEYPLTIGSNTFIPGFEEQMVGHSVGEEFDVSVTFPENYNAAELAGKPAVFKVKVRELKEKQLPELDDEFAKDVSDFDTFADYKADLKKKMEEAHEKAAEAEFENKLVDAVVADMKAEVPSVMIEARVKDLIRDFEYRLGQQGLNLDNFMKYTGENPDAFNQSFVPQAERQVRARLAMEAIVKAEKIVVSEEELEKEYKNLSEQYKMDVDKLKIYLPEKDISLDMACTKAIEILKENAKPAKPAKAEKKTEKAEKAEEAAPAPKPKRTKKAAAAPSEE